MNITRTNITKWDMNTAYSVLESEDRGKLSNIVPGTKTLGNYAVYEDALADGEIKTLLSVELDGEVYVTNSPTFINSFHRLLDIAERCGEQLTKIEVTKEESRAGRSFMNAKLAR